MSIKRGNKKAQSILGVILVILLIFGGIIAFDLYNRPYSAQGLKDQINQTKNEISQLDARLNNPSIPLAKGEATEITQRIASLNAQKNRLETQLADFSKKAAEAAEKPGWLSKIVSPFAAMIGYESTNFLNVTVNMIAVIIASFLTVFFVWFFRHPGVQGRKMITAIKQNPKEFLPFVIPIILLPIIAFIVGEEFAVIALPLMALFVVGAAIYGAYLLFLHNRKMFVIWAVLGSILLFLYLLLAFFATPLKVILFPLFSDYGMQLSMTYQELINPIAKAIGKQAVDYASYNNLLWGYIKLVLTKALFTAIYLFAIVLVFYSPIAAKNIIVKKINEIKEAKREEERKLGRQQARTGLETLRKVGGAAT